MVAINGIKYYYYYTFNPISLNTNDLALKYIIKYTLKVIWANGLWTACKKLHCKI